MKQSILKKLLLLTAFSLASTALFAQEVRNPVSVRVSEPAEMKVIKAGCVLSLNANSLKGNETYQISKSLNPSVRLYVVDAFPSQGEALPTVFGQNSVYFEVSNPEVLSLMSSHIGYGDAAGPKGTVSWMGNALLQESYFKPVAVGSTKVFVRFTDVSGHDLAKEITINVVE